MKRRATLESWNLVKDVLILFLLLVLLVRTFMPQEVACDCTGQTILGTPPLVIPNGTVMPPLLANMSVPTYALPLPPEGGDTPPVEGVGSPPIMPPSLDTALPLPPSLEGNAGPAP